MESAPKKKPVGRIVPSRYMSAVSKAEPSENKENTKPAVKSSISTIKKAPVPIKPKAVSNTSTAAPKSTVPKAASSTTSTVPKPNVPKVASSTSTSVPKPNVPKTTIKTKPVSRESSPQPSKSIPTRTKTPPMPTSEIISSAGDSEDLSAIRARYIQWLYYKKMSEKAFESQKTCALSQISRVQNGIYHLESETVEQEAYLEKLKLMKQVHDSLEEQENYLTALMVSLKMAEEPLKNITSAINNANWRIPSKQMTLDSVEELEYTVQELDAQSQEFKEPYENLTRVLESLKELTQLKAAEESSLDSCNDLLEESKDLFLQEASLKVHNIQLIY